MTQQFTWSTDVPPDHEAHAVAALVAKGWDQRKASLFVYGADEDSAPALPDPDDAA